MIMYYKGTVFNVNADAIVNTVNCDGFMGAGIALEFMLRFPDMYEDYLDKCKNNIIKTGKVDYFKSPDGLLIINFPTKHHFRYPSKMIWIEAGLSNFVDTVRDYNITSVAFPKLGTKNGGLDWKEVSSIMEKYLSDLEIDIYICLDDLDIAEGIEKSMLDRFNSTSINDLSKLVRLSNRQKEMINRHIPYRRFWHIYKTESIGIKTYHTIFRLFYRKAILDSDEPTQISLF